jgi:hypothetical protein
MSIVATSISIILTFGTAYFVDKNKKENAKLEIAKMIIFDMDQTIKKIEGNDSLFNSACQTQLQIAQNPASFDSLKFGLVDAANIGLIKFSETTERVFSTSIETFNTIGNVNFINEVSEFYIQRQGYKEQVVEKLANELKGMAIYQSEKDLFEVDFPEYVLDNKLYLIMMKKKRDKCMKMMDVSEQEMEAFSQQRVTATSDSQEDSLVHTLCDELQAAEAVIDSARKRYQQE